MYGKRSGNKFRRCQMGGRIAGAGTFYDDYSEESGNPATETVRPLVRFSTDNIPPEALNGPVVCVKKGKNADETAQPV